jgi:hypothetical protein
LRDQGIPSRAAPVLAGSGFLDVLDVFLLFLQIFRKDE